MAKKPYKDEDWFRSQWYTSRSREEIAEKAGCSVDTVTRYARIYGLPSLWDATPWNDEERLRELYHEEGMSGYEIGEKWDCNATTVYKKMEEFGIDRRNGDDVYYNRDPHPCFKNDPQGYEMVASERRGKTDAVAIHQLLAIAHGADPSDVFSGRAGYHVHHKNGIKWDNRPSNLEVLPMEEHMRHHATKNNPRS